MAVLVGVIAHGAEDDAGHIVLGGDLAHGRALHLHAVGGAFGLDGGFGGAVAHEHIAGGDLACQSLDACVGAGFLGGGDQGRVAGVLLQERRILADHIQLGVVVKHRLADDYVADADLAGHVACDAGEDDLLRTELGDEHLSGGGSVGLAHACTADDHLLAGQCAFVILHAAVGLDRDIFQPGAELVHFVGHCAHDTDNHNFNPFLLWLPFLGELSSGSETERLFLCFRH